jgi:hypothetical protein
LNEVRRNIHDVGLGGVERLNLDTAREDFARLAALSRRPRAPKPLRPKHGINELYNIVASLKQDVKLIREAQSAVGA